MKVLHILKKNMIPYLSISESFEFCFRVWGINYGKVKVFKLCGYHPSLMIFFYYFISFNFVEL